MDQPRAYEYRYQVIRDGRKVGWVEAEFHGRAIWQISHPDFVEPAEPHTMEHLDEVLYALGFEVMPDE